MKKVLFIATLVILASCSNSTSTTCKDSTCKDSVCKDSTVKVTKDSSIKK